MLVVVAWLYHITLYCCYEFILLRANMPISVAKIFSRSVSKGGSEKSSNTKNRSYGSSKVSNTSANRKQHKKHCHHCCHCGCKANRGHERLANSGKFCVGDLKCHHVASNMNHQMK